MNNHLKRFLYLSCMAIAVCALSYFINLNTFDEEASSVSGLDSADIVPLAAEEQEPEPEPEAAPVIKTVTISATGDCALGKLSEHGYSGSFCDYYDSYGSDYFFKNVREIFAADDFTLINLESVLSTSDDLVPKAYNIKGAPDYSSIISAGAIEGVTMGNNHTFDYGSSGHEDTIKAVESEGLAYAFNDHYGIYTTTEGITIGFVSSNLCPSYSDGNADYIKNGITALKGQVDIIIACPHWGVEKENYPNSTQTSLGHEFIDLGADLVIGNHPHVLQGIEVYNGKVICYSLGNFCFGANRNPSDKDTVIFQQTFTFEDDIMQPDLAARIIPCTINSGSGANDFCPSPASDRYDRILERMNTYSASALGVSFDESGAISVQ